MKKRNLLSLVLLAAAWMAGSSASAHDGGHSYTNGICTIDGCEDMYQAPELDTNDGYFKLENAGNVEWVSAAIKNKLTYTDGENSVSYAIGKFKMTRDIDFDGVTHNPIGYDTNTKFNGIFDGKEHHIKNLTVSATNCGFFGWVRGGSTIQNLIIDATCTFTATERCGALIAFIQAKAGGAVSINNVVNFGTVNSGSKVAGGIIAAGATNNDHPVVNMANCVNAGKITCTSGSDRAAGLLGWNKSASISTLKGCYNIGECTPLDGVNNLFRGSNRSMPNTYDLVNTTAQGKTGTQGLKNDWKTADPLHSGELCVVLNKGDMSANGTVYTQDLSDPNSIPMPISTGKTVYEVAEYKCDGSVIGDPTYTNVETPAVIPAHNFNENGFCTVCGGINKDYLVADAEGFYHLSTVAQVEWFAAMINTVDITLSAKLDADIDYKNVENAHTPIGNTEQMKFNGTFDGQGHRILNMIINRPENDYQGFFGYFRGNANNTTVKNLIIDKSCSIHGKNRIGALVGAYQNGGMTITIENVVNEAEVIAEGQDAGGIIGGHVAGNPTIIIKNVVNTGTITAKNENPYAGALCCYLGLDAATSKIENFLNLGTVNGHLGGNIGRYSATDVANIIDLSATENKDQGVVEGLTTDDVTNGKVAYILGMKQLIGTDAYPSPFNTAEVKYVGEAGYATMVAAADTKLNGDAKAYIGKVNDKVLKLTEVADVPAGAAVVLKGTYYNTVATTATADVAGNELKAATEDITADGTQYVLAKVGDVVGFYKAAEGTIKAGKAYLTSAAGVKAFFFGEDENATGISQLNAQSSQLIYNIAGQRVSKMQKGINIVNGKKVLF